MVKATRCGGVTRMSHSDPAGSGWSELTVGQRRLSLICVLGACLFVFWQMRPDLVFTENTPAGGDMAAHVWGPAFLRDHLLPSGRLSGWSTDWYAGFPAYQFYMVLPSLAIALASYIMPYGVAFKLVSIVGLVTLPLAAATFVWLAGLRFPAPSLAAVFMLPFVFDTSFTIFGGNAASTLAGEFAYSISLSLMLVYLGVALRGLRTGRHHVLAGILLALVGLTHLIPAMFALAATGVALIMRPGWRNVRWLATAGSLAATLSAFWLLPFWWRRDYFHNIDWVNLTEYWVNLVPDGSGWVFALAWVGVLLGMLRRQQLALYLAAVSAVAAAAFRWMPQGVVWNARILPFYYVSMLLLAAVGAATLLVTLTTPKPLMGASEKNRKVSTAGDGGARGSRRRIVAAAAMPTLGGAVIVDNLATQGAALRALVAVSPGVDSTTASARAPDITHLAVLIVAAAAIVTVAAMIAALRSYRQAPAETPTGAAPGRPATGPASRQPSGDTPPHRIRPLMVASAALTLIVVLSVAYPLRVLGPIGHDSSDGRYGIRVGPDTVLAGTTNASFIPFWVSWNFSGYESKQPRGPGGGYEEYERIVSTMAQLGDERGCGRVMWEYNAEHLDSYGSPMSLMLLPYWTDGCLASMEGLFFESTHTVPFHFINQDELSTAPSRPVRAVQYGGVDIDAGIAHMQLLGVRYYMALSPTLVTEAWFHPDLEEVATQPPWVVFEVSDAPLVAPLAAEPAVVVDIGDDEETWRDVAVSFYRDYVDSGALEPGTIHLSSDAVFPATDGPATWHRGAAGDDFPVRVLPEVTIDAISTTRDSISFRVSEPDVPVLVKTSYFPNWRAENAAGPYRVAPNLMVVVPNSTRVTLRYGSGTLEGVSWALTVAGAFLALLLALRSRSGSSPRTRDPAGDD